MRPVGYAAFMPEWVLYPIYKAWMGIRRSGFSRESADSDGQVKATYAGSCRPYTACRSMMS
jgi:hypothetical protein